MKEQFRPVSHHPPVGVINSVIFYCRLAVDFQMCTIFRQLKNIIPDFRGKILDIGCGNSPFKFLVDTSKASYIGIDIEDAGNFNYNNPDKIKYDGENLPFENESLENIISTEVLEHIEKPEKIIDEMYRVLKPGG
ncbi:MAG: class I SAM-dependent methyltransferase, partial [Tannerella sp.]|nr:class I SAM-dependent methyltransferase [Tannerella sp.]